VVVVREGIFKRPVYLWEREEKRRWCWSDCESDFGNVLSTTMV